MLEAPEILDVVKEAWREEVIGDPWYVLTIKLKKVKESMRRLNTSKSNLHFAVEDDRNALLDFQLAMPSLPSEQQFKDESKLRKDLQDLLKKEEVFLRQKSRVTG